MNKTTSDTIGNVIVEIIKAFCFGFLFHGGWKLLDHITK